MTGKIEFFYDFSSPYAYLAHEEVERVAELHEADVHWRPFLLGGLFKALGSSIAPIADATPAKRRHLHADLQRWAEVRDLPFRWPTRFPMLTILPLRVVLQLKGQARKAASAAIYRAYWGADLDISDPKVLAMVLSDAGLDAAALLSGCGDPAIKAQLRANTEELLARGGVGAPAFLVGDFHVWGQDRFEFVERALQGWNPDSD